MLQTLRQMTNEITIGGDTSCSGGVYILWLRVAAPLAVVFGRFHGGQPIAVPAGNYFYVGSALNGLGARLLRHATRRGDHPPHALRDQLAGCLAAAGLPARPPAAKRLRWHVDYLLDEPDAALIGVWAWRTAAPLESALAAWLAAQPDISPLAQGLGASDDPGRTHLLQVAQDSYPVCATSKEWNADDAE